MNPLVFQFANGNTFFAGLLLSIAGLGLLFRFRRKFLTVILTISVIVGILLVLLSATPLPLWQYILWLGLLLPALILSRMNSLLSTWKMFRIAIFAAFCLFSLMLGLVELPYHRMPTVTVPPQQNIYVVGDSISIALGQHDRPWPAVWAETSQRKIINLAEAGATSESALQQIDRIPDSQAVVLLEIGGNDLLGRTDSRIFATHLDTLLARLHARGHRVVMFELPLPPLFNSFGRIQRSLADKYGVPLVPKKFMTNILGMKDGTLDGIHLSQTGHNAWARAMGTIITGE